MTLASAAAQQTSALAAANAAAANPSVAGASPAAASRASLSGDFDDFLKLLMTQLKNQDPSNPLDTTQFTTQLVQFASVEQQINANSNLTQLIELTQGEQVMQSSQMVGKQVLVKSDQIVLQDGAGTIRFDSAGAQPVGVAVYNAAGVKLTEAVVTAKPGTNEWTWDGRAANGARMKDGGYRIAVIGAQSDGTTAALPFTVRATATGVQRDNGNVTVRLGTAGVPMSSVQAVLDSTAR